GATAGGRLRLVVAGAAAAAALGAELALLAVVAEGSGRSVGGALGIVTDVAPDTRPGRLAVLRVALAALAAVAAVVPSLWRRSPAPALALAAGSLVATSVAGHAWTAPDRWVAVTSDVAHLGAVAVWIGGLPALLAVLPVLDHDRRARTATRFSAVALGAVGVVAVTGAVSGWQQVRTLDALATTGYGRLLVVKVVGFAVLVVLGYVNRSVLVPLVGRRVGPLRRSLRLELVVAALVLAVTAALVHRTPPRVTTSEPVEVTVTAGTGDVLSATVDPAEAGRNDIHLYFSSGGAAGPVAVDAVQVTAAREGLPPRRLRVVPVSTDHVSVVGASLPSPGRWTLEVTAVRAGEPLVFSFEVPIP
ncbi:MAG TPA: CopD family protein, partial [Acidimicrobiales bacterium]|nr:CopD family protein [Acidimicrobiales bacterium]